MPTPKNQFTLRPTDEDVEAFKECMTRLAASEMLPPTVGALQKRVYHEGVMSLRDKLRARDAEKVAPTPPPPTPPDGA